MFLNPWILEPEPVMTQFTDAYDKNTLWLRETVWQSSRGHVCQTVSRNHILFLLSNKNIWVKATVVTLWNDISQYMQ